jgi:hypothetical protein
MLTEQSDQKPFPEEDPYSGLFQEEKVRFPK